MEVERDGEVVAKVQKALITPLRDRFAIELAGGGELSAKGNIVDHEYEIERDGEKVARDFEALVPGQGDVRHRGRRRPG